ncbi:hypothetical protein [Prevotella melaninogenica]|nr:hypothetical protein [Prevotella melaninogenica]
MCLVLRTIGAEAEHHWCEPLARHVRSSRTWVEDGKKGASRLL